MDLLDLEEEVDYDEDLSSPPPRSPASPESEADRSPRGKSDQPERQARSRRDPISWQDWKGPGQAEERPPGRPGSQRPDSRRQSRGKPRSRSRSPGPRQLSRPRRLAVPFRPASPPRGRRGLSPRRVLVARSISPPSLRAGLREHMGEAGWRSGGPPLHDSALEHQWRRLHEFERLLHREQLALREWRELERLRPVPDLPPGRDVRLRPLRDFSPGWPRLPMRPPPLGRPRLHSPPPYLPRGRPIGGERSPSPPLLRDWHRARSRELAAREPQPRQPRDLDVRIHERSCRRSTMSPELDATRRAVKPNGTRRAVPVEVPPLSEKAPRTEVCDIEAGAGRPLRRGAPLNPDSVPRAERHRDREPRSLPPPPVLPGPPSAASSRLDQLPGPPPMTSETLARLPTHRNGQSLSRRPQLPGERCEWYYLDPKGVVQGPSSKSQLKNWLTQLANSNDTARHRLFCNVTVWKEGQSRATGVPLLEMLAAADKQRGFRESRRFL